MLKATAMNENQPSFFKAFDKRAKPLTIINVRGIITPEQESAVEIGKKAREVLTADDWERHFDAFYTLSSDAFIYYLPSMLALTYGDTRRENLITSSIIGVLDRSPEVKNWDNFIIDRFFGLTDAEYVALEQWLLSLSIGNSSDEDALIRSFETISLLRLESRKTRDLFH
jgi:hypothetical protein